MIFVGVISGLSIGRLFLGGVIPGLIMGLFLAITVAITTRKRNYPVVKKEINWMGLLDLLKDTLFALLAPLIIILGVVFGIVTLVEVAVLANFYILLIALFIYRSIRFKDIPKIFAKAAVFSTSIMIIFAVVGLYQYIVASEQLGEKLGLLVASLNLNQFTFLLLANLFFLFMGCILDAVPVMLIFFPVL